MIMYWKNELNGTAYRIGNEKDLSVMIRKDLKASSQSIKIVKTANQILGMIKRTIFKTNDNLLQL